MNAQRPKANPTQLLLTATGVLFVLCALFYNQWAVALAVKAARSALNRPGMGVPSAPLIRESQLIYAVCAALALAGAWYAGRATWVRRPMLQKLTLATVALVVPILTLEVAVRPFAARLRKETSLFVKDDTLGWKLRSGAVDKWGGVPVRINNKGVRGPELDYAKPEGTRRILYLGDSVIFGFRIEDDADTFPAVVENTLTTRTKTPLQSINAGCGGYSPWQEHAYLTTEGYKYDPDIVVVGFVLNDVTEKFDLVKFGGVDEGLQLSRSYTSRLDRVLSYSALLTEIRRFTREFKARRRFGDDVQAGAIAREALNVNALIEHPEHESVVKAWNITLMNLRQVQDYCNENDLQMALVVFPFKVQLASPRDSAAPQLRLAAWARDRGIPILDILPPLAAHVEQTGTDPESLYFDHDHFTESGTRVVSAMIAGFLEQWVASGEAQ